MEIHQAVIYFDNKMLRGGVVVSLTERIEMPSTPRDIDSETDSLDAV